MRDRQVLILTRKVDESIVLNDDIVIRVLNVKGRQVRLGIDAPRDVSVHREEVHERIERARGAPAGPADGAGGDRCASDD